MYVHIYVLFFFQKIAHSPQVATLSHTYNLMLPQDNADVVAEGFAEFKDDIQARFSQQAYKVRDFERERERKTTILSST
jgi:hypothetical protein